MYFALITEYNPLEPPKLNEKVLKDKRKKLKETFQRVLRLYVSLQMQIAKQTVNISLLYLKLKYCVITKCCLKFTNKCANLKMLTKTE